MSDPQPLAWPADRLGEAVEALVLRAGLASPPLPRQLAGDPPDATRRDAVGRWLEASLRPLGLEAEAVEAAYPELASMLARAGPALLALPGESPRFLLLLGRGLLGLRCLGPDLRIRRVGLERLRHHLTAELEAPHRAALQPLLDEALPEPQRGRALQAMLDDLLADSPVGGCWILRLSPAANFFRQMRLNGLLRRAGLLFGLQMLMQGLQVLGWFLIVRGALAGELDRAWVLAWALLLFTQIPVRMLMLWLQSLLTVGAGSLFKQRLLYGTLQLSPEEIRHQGNGQFMSRVMESEAVETLVLGGGFAGLAALVELGSAVAVLVGGADDWLTAGLLSGWTGLTLVVAWRFARHSKDWRDGHRLLLNALVERMVGHRTRLAQENPASWHDEEDQLLDSYGKLEQRLDRTQLQLSHVTSRGWLLLGFSGLVLALASGNTDPARLAIMLGGVILGYRGLADLTLGVQSLVGVINAWQQVGPLFRAARRGLAHTPPGLGGEAHTPGGGALLSVRDLGFRYRSEGRWVLQDCRLSIQRGERLLLEGASGGGKSTLAALLTGLRAPSSGLMLLGGLDRQTLGTERWRERVISAPQFHENHVLSETFAFNLLMGRGWPPEPEDLAEAEQICEELGLGALLARMPGGLQQMVGESGWQLSHGERSRLYIARALLQRAEMIVLDESFAALDPENLRRALRCVLARAPTLLVIAHP